MGKRGPKPSSPNGEPKKRVTLALASDVIDFMYAHKPTVPWLESVMRDLRAEESRDFGAALTPENVSVPSTIAADALREAKWSGVDDLLRRWTYPKHADHISSIARILDSQTDLESMSFRCSKCHERLFLDCDTRFE